MTPSPFTKKRSPSATSDFFNGLVFGFDVGTGSIGWAVRKADKFLDVGVLICPEDTSDLSGRRGLRRQRRTLRSRKYRRQWFAIQLGLLDLPRPSPGQHHDPITLRLRALAGDSVTRDELHAALVHLFRRRGYTPVPWANTESANAEDDGDKEEGQIKQAVSEITEKMETQGLTYPCQWLDYQRNQAGKSPVKVWGRKIYWPRELLEKEFRAIAAAQSQRFPKLAEKADWLLYGDTRKVKGHHVFFKNSEARNPGALGLRWPRFENRGPALDSLRPLDEQGRPLHVVRKDKQAFLKAQWELAVMNFRVIDRATGGTVAPDAASMTRLRELWESARRKKKKESTDKAGDSNGAVQAVKVSEKLLVKWEKQFASRYKLIEGQQPLVPQTGAGRARYSSPTLAHIQRTISAGGRFDPPQPILRRAGETAQRALDRYLSDIKHPLVRHRLVLFRRLLAQLAARFGEPDTLVLEAVRTLALGETKRREHIQRIKENRDERAGIREDLASRGASTSRNAIMRYRLWKEAQSTCPFCCQKITQEQLLHHEADIEHLVPRSIVDCNEYHNLTVGHLDCNRIRKGDKTPYDAFHHRPEEWELLKVNAEKCFKGRKLEIFLSDKAEDLVEQKADLQHTAYIARVIRHIALIELGWLREDGRDPTGSQDPQKTAWRFQVTNGQLTSRLRKAWGLNQILHPLPAGKRWDDLTDPEQKQMQEKNRGDLRHHALDAMVIACTLPWLAHRTHGATDEQGRHGWWTQDEKQRSKPVNPVFPREGQMHDVAKKEIEKVVVKHHVSRSNHQQAYATTIYGKRDKDTYVAREVFTTLTPKNLSSIWPPDFAAYCEAAWACYADESPDIDAELKKSKGCVTEAFTRRLCFSHFQKWKAAGAQSFDWPASIKIPIRSVKLISVKDDAAVVPFAPGTPGFVKRTGFKEVRIHLAEDGKSFVPVFVPYSKNDSIPSERQVDPNRPPVAIIRRGMVVQTIKPFSAGQPPGKYRVLVTGQNQLRLLPHNIANQEAAILSFGLPRKGLQPYWPDFIKALGHELSHPPSPQPPPARAGEV
jgi:CRISPR-associated endonuclease Csn1